MSELTEKLLASLSSPGPNGSDRKSVDTPEAYRARLEVDSKDGGFLQSKARPASEMPDSAALLEDFNLDPKEWSITSVRKSQWQTYSGDTLESQRISIVPADKGTISDTDLEKLIQEISKWRPSKSEKKISGELAYVFAPSDQQLGKKQGDGGTKDTVDRLLELTNGGVERLRELRKMGRSIGTIVLPLPGDHVEGNTSQAGRLQGVGASDLGLTEQTRVARRLLMAQIKAFAPLGDKLIVPVVNGNHDEVTRQVVADPSDGWNVEIASAVQDACAENDLLSHVEFRFPEKSHQTLAIDICGTMLGLFHGHQARDPLKYLSGQAAGQTALGMCDVWISGHFHNFKTMDIGERLWLQCPTVDPGSAWFRDRAGLESLPGILTMVIGDGHNPRRDISVLSLAR
jgi:predicted phosphodiesterase